MIVSWRTATDVVVHTQYFFFFFGVRKGMLLRMLLRSNRPGAPERRTSREQVCGTRVFGVQLVAFSTEAIPTNPVDHHWPTLRRAKEQLRTLHVVNTRLRPDPPHPSVDDPAEGA